jgi:hypothetical protein
VFPRLSATPCGQGTQVAADHWAELLHEGVLPGAPPVPA